MKAAGALILGFALAGQSPESGVDRLPKNAVGAAVARGMEYAGGYNAWNAKKAVTFRKTVRRFRPDGSVETTRVQAHRYRLAPSFAARIDSEENGHKTVFINNGNQAWKLVDGKEMTSQDDVNNARNNTFGSHYVFGMPFKLTDPGVRLEDAGKETLSNGAKTQKVRVLYEKGAGDAGGLHVWTYYFDATSGRLCANLLKYDAEKYDFTEYLDDKAVGGLRLSTRRQGYNGDARGKKGPRVSETIYEDVRFDEDLPSGLFAGPVRVSR